MTEEESNRETRDRAPVSRNMVVKNDPYDRIGK